MLRHIYNDIVAVLMKDAFQASFEKALTVRESVIESGEDPLSSACHAGWELVAEEQAFPPYVMVVYTIGIIGTAKKTGTWQESLGQFWWRWLHCSEC